MFTRYFRVIIPNGGTKFIRVVNKGDKNILLPVSKYGANLTTQEAHKQFLQDFPAYVGKKFITVTDRQFQAITQKSIDKASEA